LRNATAAAKPGDTALLSCLRHNYATTFASGDGASDFPY
jgi:hypothetical protein